MRGATRLLGWFRSLSRREQGLVLLCAATILLFVLVRWAVYPVVDGHRKDLAEIRTRRILLARYEEEAKKGGDVSAALARAKERLLGLEKGILPGETPSAAEVYLQGVLKPLLDRDDTRLTSMRSLSPVEKDRYTEVAVQADLQTSTEGLAAILSGISRNGMFLRARKLTVRSRVYGRRARAGKEMLTVSLVVSGLAHAQSEDYPLSGAKERQL